MCLAAQCLLGPSQRLATKFAKSLPSLCTIFDWTHAQALKQKGEAREALLLMFKRDGVSPEMILKGSNEQVEGNFKHLVPQNNFGITA
jgi:hypothetical protein